MNCPGSRAASGIGLAYPGGGAWPASLPARNVRAWRTAGYPAVRPWGRWRRFGPCFRPWPSQGPPAHCPGCTGTSAAAGTVVAAGGIVAAAGGIVAAAGGIVAVAAGRRRTTTTKSVCLR